MPQFCFQLLFLLGSTLHFVYLRPQRLDLLFLAKNNLFQDCNLICLRWDALRCQLLIVLQSITQQLEPLLILSPPWPGHSRIRHKICPKEINSVVWRCYSLLSRSKPAINSQTQNLVASKSCEGQWLQVRPQRSWWNGGQIICVRISLSACVHQSTPNCLRIASASLSLWVTDNARMTWWSRHLRSQIPLASET